jgi:drug/metabolite transporter (DMT)-like permease
VQNIKDSGFTAIGWTVYLGIFPTAFGFAMWTFALRRTSAGRMGTTIYLVPTIAVFLSWSFLGETPAWQAIMGGVLCLAGVYLASQD